MTWSAIGAIWKNWVLAVASALGVALTQYWNGAPNLLRIAAYTLGPLLVIEALSASWMQKAARRKMAALGLELPTDVRILPAAIMDAQEECNAALRQRYGVEVYPGDTWHRAGLRFGMTFLLICLAGAVDMILGTRHMTVLWVLLWGTSGHARGTLRHLEVIAKLAHMKLPIFPDDRMERLNALTPPEAAAAADVARAVGSAPTVADGSGAAPTVEE